METEEEMVIKKTKQFREAKAVVGRPFTTTEVKSSDQNLFFQMPEILAWNRSHNSKEITSSLDKLSSQLTFSLAFACA